MYIAITQDLARGFGPWKEMFDGFDVAAMKADMGISLVFAGPHQDDDNKMIVILEFDSPEGLQKFAADEDLKAARAAAGVILDSVVVTVMGERSMREESMP